MNIVVVALLSDKKLSSKLLPLIENEEIEKIYLFRRFPLEEKKIINYCPPESLRKNKILSEIIRLFQVFYILAVKKIDYIIGIYYFLHIIVAGFFGIIFRTKTIHLIVENPKLYNNKQLFWFLMKRAFKIGVRGTNSKKYLIKRSIPKEKIFIPHNVFELKNQPIENKHKKQFDLIFIGSLNQDKRPDILIEVIYKIKSEIPDISCIMLGEGAMRKKLQIKIKEYQLERNFHFVGQVGNVDSYLKKSRILILTSQTEGMPMVIPEAMQYGVPCIVPDIGDITDIAVHNYNSKVVEPLNIDMFAKECIIILNNQERYNKMSTNAVETAKNMSLQCSIENLAKTWKEIL